MLSLFHFMDAQFGWSEDPAGSLRKAYDLAKKSIYLVDSVDSRHSLLGLVYLNKRRYDQAIGETKRGVALNPNVPYRLFSLAMVTGFAGLRRAGLRWPGLP
jgi:hypothetical protein